MADPLAWAQMLAKYPTITEPVGAATNEFPEAVALFNKAFGNQGFTRYRPSVPFVDGVPEDRDEMLSNWPADGGMSSSGFFIKATTGDISTVHAVCGITPRTREFWTRAVAKQRRSGAFSSLTASAGSWAPVSHQLDDLVNYELVAWRSSVPMSDAPEVAGWVRVMESAQSSWMNWVKLQTVDYRGKLTERILFETLPNRSAGLPGVVFLGTWSPDAGVGAALKTYASPLFISKMIGTRDSDTGSYTPVYDAPKEGAAADSVYQTPVYVDPVFAITDVGFFAPVLAEQSAALLDANPDIRTTVASLGGVGDLNTTTPLSVVFGEGGASWSEARLSVIAADGGIVLVPPVSPPGALGFHDKLYPHTLYAPWLAGEAIQRDSVPEDVSTRLGARLAGYGMSDFADPHDSEMLAVREALSTGGGMTIADFGKILTEKISAALEAASAAETEEQAQTDRERAQAEEARQQREADEAWQLADEAARKAEQVKQDEAKKRAEAEVQRLDEEAAKKQEALRKAEEGRRVAEEAADQKRLAAAKAKEHVVDQTEPRKVKFIFVGLRFEHGGNVYTIRDNDRRNGSMLYDPTRTVDSFLPIAIAFYQDWPGLSPLLNTYLTTDGFALADEAGVVEYTRDQTVLAIAGAADEIRVSIRVPAPEPVSVDIIESSPPPIQVSIHLLETVGDLKERYGLSRDPRVAKKDIMLVVNGLALRDDDQLLWNAGVEPTTEVLAIVAGAVTITVFVDGMEDAREQQELFIKKTATVAELKAKYIARVSTVLSRAPELYRADFKGQQDLDDAARLVDLGIETGSEVTIVAFGGAGPALVAIPAVVAAYDIAPIGTGTFIDVDRDILGAVGLAHRLPALDVFSVRVFASAVDWTKVEEDPERRLPPRDARPGRTQFGYVSARNLYPLPLTKSLGVSGALGYYAMWIGNQGMSGVELMQPERYVVADSLRFWPAAGEVDLEIKGRGRAPRTLSVAFDLRQKGMARAAGEFDLRYSLSGGGGMFVVGMRRNIDRYADELFELTKLVYIPGPGL